MKVFCTWIMFLLIIAAGIVLWADTQEMVREAKCTADPAIAWIGLGMQEDGSYYLNRDYINQVHSFSTTEEKTAYIREYIYQNRSRFIERKHLAAKVRFNYASGYFGTKDYIYRAEEKHENHFLWELCSPWGKYYWRGSQYTFGYIFGIYLIYFLGGALSVLQILRERKTDIRLLVADLSFLGYFIFLMIWEANNRQLYNFVPLLLVGAVLHIEQILDAATNICSVKKKYLTPRSIYSKIAESVRTLCAADVSFIGDPVWKRFLSRRSCLIFTASF